MSIARTCTATHVRIRKVLTDAVQLLPPVKRKTKKRIRIPLALAAKPAAQAAGAVGDMQP